MDKEELLQGVIKALDESPERNFTQTVEVSINFQGVNVQGEHKLNTSVVLPKGRGKDSEIGFFAEGDMKERAKEFSDHVLGKNDIEEYTKDKREMRKFANDCHAFIAQADLMPLVGKNWGVVLGPRNKMPKPLPPTADIKPTYEDLQDTVNIKTRKDPLVHVPVGAEDMNPEDLVENIRAVLREIEKTIRQDHIKSIYVKTTMGPSVKAW